MSLTTIGTNTLLKTALEQALRDAAGATHGSVTIRLVSGGERITTAHDANIEVAGDHLKIRVVASQRTDVTIVPFAAIAGIDVVTP